MTSLANITKTGNIRTKKTCPFLNRCSQKNASCPKRGNTKNEQHSCGMVRLFYSSELRRQAVAEKPIETPQEPQKIEQWSLSAIVAAKQAERKSADTWIPQAELVGYGK